jgi:hypothetical protein
MDSSYLEAQQSFPTFVYRLEQNSEKLWRTRLVTGEVSCNRVPSYRFRESCCWCEIPGGRLLITGGGFQAVKDVERIDTLREFAVTHRPPMLTAKRAHTCVYHAQLLYVLGGYSGSANLRNCERYVCAESRWEALPQLPTAASFMSAVVIEGSLYALGGHDQQHLDLIQKLRLEELTWECIKLRLPQAGCAIPCFKIRDTEVYLIINRTLCSLTPRQVVSLKTLPQDISSFCGPSYYSKGSLYCSNYNGAVNRMELSSLK